MYIGTYFSEAITKSYFMKKIDCTYIMYLFVQVQGVKWTLLKAQFFIAHVPKRWNFQTASFQIFVEHHFSQESEFLIKQDWKEKDT